MKRLILLALPALAATPALAHGGAHIHPHGFEPVIALLALACVAGVYAVMRARR